MNLKLFITVFLTIFLAEIADKTQVATLLYASQAQNNKLAVFIGSSLALIITSAIAVFIGAAMAKWVNSRYLSWISGIAFIIVGVWIILKP